MRSPLKQLVLGLGLVLGLTSSAQAQDGGRGERGERGERGDRDGRGERGERGDRDGRGERGDRGERDGRGGWQDDDDRGSGWRDPGPVPPPVIVNPPVAPPPVVVIETPRADRYHHGPRHGFGALLVTNRHDRPVVLFINGERFGKVRRGESLTFNDLPVGNHLLTFREPRGVEVMRETVFIERHRIASVEVMQPFGTVVVHNRTDRRVRVSVAGRDIGWLRPGASEFVTGVDRGAQPITWSIGRHGRFGEDSARVRVIAGQQTNFDITLATGALDVRNPHYFAVDVVVDGRRMTTLAAGASIRLASIEVGTVDVRLERRGRVLALDRVVVAANRVALFAPAPQVVAGGWW